MTAGKNKYLILFESLPGPAFLLDREGLLENMNRAAAAMLGEDASPGRARYGESLRGKPLPALAEELEKFRAAEVPSRGFEKSVATPAGRRYYQAEMHRLLDASGEVGGTVVLFTDLTRRKEAEETLQVVLDEMEARVRERAAEVARSHDLLDAVVVGVPDAVFVKDLEGRYLMINPAGARFLGKPVEEILGKDDTEFFPPDTAAAVMEGDRRVLLTGETRSYEEAMDSGGAFLVYLATKGPYRDGDGKIVGVFGTARDITERKRDEEVLRRVNRSLRMIWECGRALIRARDESALLAEVCRIVVEEGGHRLAWVGFAEDDPGKTVRPVAQAGFEEGYLETVAVTWADTERGRGPVGASIRTGDPYIVRDVHSDPRFAPWKKEAQRRGYASVLGLPLKTGDRAFGALGIYAREPDAFPPEEVVLLAELADTLAYGIRSLRTEADRVREEERREIAEKKLRRSHRMESVGRLAGGVAHNLNNLLTVINGYCFLLERDLPAEDPRRKMVEEMAKSGRDAANLTEQLLAFSRQQTLQPRELETGRLLGEMEPGLREICGGGVELDLSRSGTETIRIDPDVFRQTLARLAAGACQRMGGAGALKIRMFSADLVPSDAPPEVGLPAGRYSVLAVRDTGPGMDEESLSRVFDPFQRSLEPEEGLEFASAYGFIKQSGGYIWVESGRERGTTFTICFPTVSAVRGAQTENA